ncbi:MAG: DUF1987 domain-containing protein [Ekhidna sp.]|nr:DUF1987 domain-containing protein [Ekhidna sp.]
MEHVIEPTKVTPFVKISLTDSLLEIKGRSYSENSIGFFSVVNEKIKELLIGNDNLEVKFVMEYFNTSSAKCIFDTLSVITKLNIPKEKINVKWFYEEDDFDMLEIGKDYMDLSGLAFEFCEIEEGNFEVLLA